MKNEEQMSQENISFFKLTNNEETDDFIKVPNWVNWVKNLNVIRIIINPGRGFGHQKAGVTLMMKLRELGFNGRFDILYREYVIDTILTSLGEKNLKDLVGKSLEKLIPGFSLKNPDVLSGKGWEFEDSLLGFLKISRISDNKLMELDKVELTMSGASDAFIRKKELLLGKFNTTNFIQLQPTGWDGSFLVSETQEDGIFEKEIPSYNMRLSVEYSLDSNENTDLEEQLLLLCEDGDNLTQLVYGLYEDQINISPIRVCANLIKAALELQKTIDKKILFFFPQEIQYYLESIISEVKLEYPELKNIYHIKEGKVSVESVKNLPKNAIVLVHTGPLRGNFFDYLMLSGTSLPPIIEGCNALESCEFHGIPFIHGMTPNHNLRIYDLLESGDQTLHKNACLCLETGDLKKIESLTEYMVKAHSQSLTTYHQSRKNEYLKKMDMCEYALEGVYECAINKNKIENKFNDSESDYSNEDNDQLNNNEINLY